MIRNIVGAALFAYGILGLECAHADQRVALVIGNSAYLHTPRLENPKNDASDIAGALSTLGFRVIEGRDLDKVSFDRKMREFADALSRADVGVFFYAGHGLQVSGQNYLVPVDAQLTTVSALDFEMVRIDVVHRTMEREAKVNILFLDACRDNPLARNLARAMGTRSADIGRGLAPVESGIGTLISFSTQPGNVALDGTERNSPFTSALLKHMISTNEDLSALLISVRNDVISATRGKQVPWEHSALTGRFFFNAAIAPKPNSDAMSTQAWQDFQAAARIGSKEAWQVFINTHPSGFYANLARAHLAKLNSPELGPVPTHKEPKGSAPAAAPAIPKGRNTAAENARCCTKVFRDLQFQPSQIQQACANALSRGLDMCRCTKGGCPPL